MKSPRIPSKLFRFSVSPLIAVCCLAALTIATRSAIAADPPRFMIEATVRGEHLEGMPLAWSDERVLLLGRDGRLWDFSPGDARDYRKTAADFSPYSLREMRGLLEAELGRQVEVSATTHYLVAHPVGQGEYWSERFEQMYREFVHYFGVRGIAMRQPETPLVAIVFARHEDFLLYARRDGFAASAAVLGYYSPRTNRVALYDFGGGHAGEADWRQNGATVVHEAAHQVAFNTGVHSRVSLPPRWLAEGMGTMFEARGVWNSHDYREQSDRINRGRLADFKQFAASDRNPGWLPSLVGSDRPFQQNVPLAYCKSWALTFYLVETQGAAYARYLAKTAARPALAPYTSTERLADFTAAFGSDWQMLDARLKRFIDELR
jgi:hypothetical protein